MDFSGLVGNDVIVLWVGCLGSVGEVTPSTSLLCLWGFVVSLVVRRSPPSVLSCVLYVS